MENHTKKDNTNAVAISIGLFYLVVWTVTFIAVLNY